MSVTRVIQNKELTERLLIGVNTIGDAVGATLGCNGRNVLVPETDPRKIGKHKVTKDGVTVARSIANLEDKIANVAAQMIKDVATAAHKYSGDGTTTATVLAQAIFVNGIKYLSENPNANPIELNKGIQWATQKVVEYIKEKAIQIDQDQDKLTQVATIAANNDSVIGKIVGEVMSDLGKDGVVCIEMPQNCTETVYKPTLGFEIASGYISERFINQKEVMSCEYQNPFILLCEDKITMFKELLPALKLIESTRRPLLIICENIEGEALNAVNTNAAKGMPVCAIRIPAIGAKKNELLNDIQSVTGGIIFSQTTGMELISLTEDNLGGCGAVIITAYGTALFGGYAKKEDSLMRIDQLNNQLPNADTEGAIKWIKDRLTTLQTKRGTIYVGGQSDVERKELADRIDDAVCACKSAMEEGIVPGGGIILHYFKIDGFINLNNDFKEGVAVLSLSIRAPFNKIISNSGLNDDIWKNHTTGFGSYDVGYNAKTNKWENLIESGVIDPAKVVRVALESAASIAGTLLTTTCGVYYE